MHFTTMFTSNTAAVQKSGSTHLTSMLFSYSPAVAAQQCSSWNKPRIQSFCGQQRSRSSFLSAQTFLSVRLPVCRYQNRKCRRETRQTQTARFSQPSLLESSLKMTVGTHTHTHKTFSVRRMINYSWIPQLSFNLSFSSEQTTFHFLCIPLPRNIL